MDYVFFGDKRIARRDADSSVHFYFSNHLGSTSVVTNSDGSTIEQDVDYSPFGGLASGTIFRTFFSASFTVKRNGFC